MADILTRRAAVLGGVLAGVLAAHLGASPTWAQAAPAPPAPDLRKSENRATIAVLVTFQMPDARRRNAVLDLFYLAIGAVGFLALWAIVRLCDRV